MQNNIEIQEQVVGLVDSTKGAGKKIELIARVCYGSESKMSRTDGENDNFLRKLIKMGHESVFEHAHATLAIRTNRAIANELTRHRLASYTQESTRYCKYDEVYAIIPSSDTIYGIKDAYKHYVAMLHDDNMPPEIARDILPLCMATNMYVTANLREWKHILKLRLGKGAHPLMRSLAEKMLYVLRPVLPVYFEDIK